MQARLIPSLLYIVAGLIFSLTVHAYDDLKDIAVKFKDATTFYLLAQKYVMGGGTGRDYAEALKWFTEAAKLGHTKSKLQLGKMYYEGLGTNIDYEQSAIWLAEPAEQGYNDAQYMLGMINLRGAGKTIPKNEGKAFDLIKKAAEDFNGNAIYQLAKMYHQGIGTKADVDKAKKYAQLAMEEQIEGGELLLAKIESSAQSGKPPVSENIVVKKSATELLLESAENGDKFAQYDLGQSYLNGSNGFSKDTQKAVKWISSAADRGHQQAQFTLGLFYYNGEVLHRNLTAAKQWLAKAAESGIDDAKVLLNSIVSAAKEKTNDKPASTSDLFLAAANKGDKDAQYKVGLMYLYGDEGLPRDERRALEWLLAAAKQNHTNAQFQTGMMYYRPGMGDNDSAEQWLIKAAENGHIDAQYFLGTIYNRQERYDNAVKWLDVAFQNNHQEALDLLVDLYISGRTKNIESTRVLAWLEQAGRNGFREAQYQLGEFYLQNDAIPNNAQKAYAWIERAARKGLMNAQYKLALLLQTGKGVDKHYTKSSRWMREAAEQGHAQAQYELGELYRQGLGVPKSDAKAKLWYKAAAEQGHMEAKVRLGTGGRF